MLQYAIPGLAAAALVLCCTAAPAGAACLTDEQVAALAEAYFARQPADNIEGLTSADGECTRDKFNVLLQTKLGEAVGFKAGLTNPAVQQRFSHNAPVRGTLYAPMLLENGARVAAAFGSRPLFEADLLVRVSSSAINRAETIEAVLQAIDQVIPFIELPDLMVAEPARLNGAAIMAINVGARLGVMGTAVPVAQSPAFADALRNMQVVVRGDGQELDRGRGSDVLDHPLNAVIWLARDLAGTGRALQPGDLVSVGSFSRLLPPRPGLAVSIEYQGLPGNPQVNVSFD